MKQRQAARLSALFRLDIDLFDQPISPSLACQNMRENGWRLGRTKRQPNRIVVKCENLNKREGAPDWIRGSDHVIDVKSINIVKSSDDFFFCEVVFLSPGTNSYYNQERHYVCDGIAGLTALVADLREEQRVKKRRRR